MTTKIDFSPTRSLANDYRFESPIASGTFGQVQKATKLDTQSPVAIKTVKGQHATRQLNFEIANLKTFQGIPHSLTLRQGITGEKPVVVSDQIPGKDVLRTMNANPHILMPFDEWVTIAKQLLEFLEGAHRCQQFHGDLKGDNVIFEKEARHLTVIDYNGAGQEGQRQSWEVLQGAPFKAPEIIMLGMAKKELDIWSAGCMLFKFLTGKDLFPVSFTPSPQNTSISDNQHLHMIVDMLGMPTVQYLQFCLKSDRYFHLDSSTFVKPLRPVDSTEWNKIKASYRAVANGKPATDSLHLEMGKVYWKQECWKTVVSQALDRRKVSPDEKQQVIDLFSQMVRYENRASASELLTNPLFKNDVHFHLILPSDFGAKSSDKIVFYRDCDVQLNVFPDTPSILIDRQIRVTRHCYHLPKDPSDRYFVVVLRGEEKILVESLSIGFGDRIVLEENEGQLKLRRKLQEEAVDEVYQATQSLIRERTPSIEDDEDSRKLKKLKFDEAEDESELPPTEPEIPIFATFG